MRGRSPVMCATHCSATAGEDGSASQGGQPVAKICTNHRPLALSAQVELAVLVQPDRWNEQDLQLKNVVNQSCRSRTRALCLCMQRKYQRPCGYGWDTESA